METPLQYQLEMLKLEVETINQSIRQMDDITKNIKQWSITLWTAAIGGALIRPELTKYIGLTLIIPILFWFLDATHRGSQRKFIWRAMEIKDFLNDGRLAESFKAGKLIEFEVLNPMARSKKEGKGNDYKEFVRLGHVIRFRELIILYGGLTALSILISLITKLFMP